MYEVISFIVSVVFLFVTPKLKLDNIKKVGWNQIPTYQVIHYLTQKEIQKKKDLDQCIYERECLSNLFLHIQRNIKEQDLEANQHNEEIQNKLNAIVDRIWELNENIHSYYLNSPEMIV